MKKITAFVFFIFFSNCILATDIDKFFYETDKHKRILEKFISNNILPNEILKATKMSKINEYKIDYIYILLQTKNIKKNELYSLVKNAPNFDRNTFEKLFDTALTNKHELYLLVKNLFYPKNFATSKYHELIYKIESTDQIYRKIAAEKLHDSKHIEMNLMKQKTFDSINCKLLQNFFKEYGWLNYRQYDTSRLLYNRILIPLSHFHYNWNLIKSILNTISDSTNKNIFFYDDLYNIRRKILNESYHRIKKNEESYASIGELIFSDKNIVSADDVIDEFKIINEEMSKSFDNYLISVFIPTPVNSKQIKILKKYCIDNNVHVLNASAIEYLSHMGIVNLNNRKKTDANIFYIATMKNPKQYFYVDYQRNIF